MKKNKLLQVFVLLLCLFTFTSCNKKDVIKLAKPKISLMNNQTIVWDKIDKASGYSVKLNGETVQDGAKTLYSLEDNHKDESFEISVNAYSNNPLYAQNASDSLQLRRLDSPKPYISEIGGKMYLRWHKVEGASSYTVKINKNTSIFNSNDELSLSLPSGVNQISLSSNSETRYVLDSLDLNFEIDAGNSSDLDAPVVNILGAKASWEPVKGAIDYTVFVDDKEVATSASTKYLHTKKTNGVKINVRANGIFDDTVSELSEDKTLILDEVTMVKAGLEVAKTFTSLKIDVSGVAIASTIIGDVTQTNSGTRIFNFGQDVSISALSKGKISADAQYYHRYNDTVVHKKDGSSNPTFTSSTLEEYKTKFGRDPFQFFLYKVDNDTIDSIVDGLVYDKAENEFTFTISLKMNGIEVNQKEVIDFGGLSKCVYTSCKLTFKINSDMQIKSYVSVDGYTATTMGFNAKTVTTTTQVFSHYKEPQAIDHSWVK